jgi:hypothetical protein
MENRLSVEITQSLYGMVFNAPSKYGMEISGQHVYGIALTGPSKYGIKISDWHTYGMVFNRKMMVPDVGKLGIETGSV